MKHTTLTALCCSLLALYSAPAGVPVPRTDHNHAVHDHDHDKGLIALPVQVGAGTAYIAPAQADNASQWAAFRQRYGDWTVLIDKATGTPHHAFGAPIRIAGYEAITADNVEAAAAAFLREHADVLRIDPSHLRLVRKTFVNNRWYVSYVQVENGVEVLLSEVELRIFANGNVMAFGVDYYNGIDVPQAPSLTYAAAAARATAGLAHAQAAPAPVQGQAARPWILPVKTGETVGYRLVYKVPVYGDEGERYLAYVDANSGDVVWRYNRVAHAATEIGVQGGVKRTSPLDAETVEFFPYQYVTVDGERLTTDNAGRLQADVQSAAAVTATLAGPYAVIASEGGTQAAYSGTVQPGQPLTIEWNDGNSGRLERNMFYHVNRIRELVKGIDPDMTAMDIPIYVTLEYSGSMVNAYSNGDSIVFLAVGDQSMFMADGPSVLYHEYGHSLNNLLYQSLGRTDGMVNRASHEGMADVNAALWLDDPRVGIGVFAEDPDNYIRTIANDMVYPDSAVGESHADGQILAAAFWDLRNTVSLEYARWLSHFAKYGTPDDPDDGVAFGEWFIESLVADDDDGNLMNGTPHAAEIIAAFNRHQIGTNLLARRSFAHTPLDDTKIIDQPYTADFRLEGLGILGIELDSVVVVYTTDDFATTYVVPAMEVADNNYSAAIPPQPKGTYVQYYIQAWDPFGQATIRFSGGSSSRPYGFLVGYSIAVSDKFEQEQGWTVGSPNDNTNSGRWQLATPEVIDLNEFGGGDILLQPGEDHSPDGSKCFVTGPRGGFSFFQDLLNGTTTLTSPAYDLSALEKPVIRMYRWLSILSLTGDPATETYLRMEYSTDGGTQWTPLETSTESGRGWEKILYPVPVSAHTAQQFRVRFVARSVPPPDAEFPIAPVLKALIDDFDILTINEVIAGVDETEQRSTITSRPNPFSSATTIGYSLVSSGPVSVTVHSMLGEEVVTLVEGIGTPGDHAVEWNGRDGSGRLVAPGLYFVRVQSEGGVKQRTVVRY